MATATQQKPQQNQQKPPQAQPSQSEVQLEAMQAVLAELKAMRTEIDEAKQPITKAAAVFAGAEKVAATAKSEEDEKRFGFKSFGEFTRAVQHAGMRNTKIDDRLLAKAVSGLSEGSAPDGGFLIPPEWANNIWTRVYENDLISRTTKFTCSGNNMTFPAIDETSRADGSRFGGIQAYWLDEAAQKTSSKPKFRHMNMVLHKLAALAFVTEELLSDAMVALDQYLFNLFAMEIQFKVGDALVNGTGAGMPLGVLLSPALVSVAAEPGQGAATILTENIVKMWARLWAPSQSNAAWFVNQNIFPQLHLMTLGVGTGGVVTFMPPGGLSGAPYATLMGRPIITTEFQPGLGTLGDILLADMTQYYTLSKGAPETETSMHLRFEYDEMAFRVVFRVDGRPIWHSPLTPYRGTAATQSPFVALATR